MLYKCHIDLSIQKTESVIMKCGDKPVPHTKLGSFFMNK